MWKKNARKLIQESSHNPSIDAKASLQLVLLKLRQGIEFGDVIVNGCVSVYDEDKVGDNMAIEDFDLSDPSSISNFIYKTGLNIDQNFFSVLRDNKISSTKCEINNLISHKFDSCFDKIYLLSTRTNAKTVC